MPPPSLIAPSGTSVAVLAAHLAVYRDSPPKPPKAQGSPRTHDVHVERRGGERADRPGGCGDGGIVVSQEV